MADDGLIEWVAEALERVGTITLREWADLAIAAGRRGKVKKRKA